MISLEHVQLLETKVAKAIEYVQRVTAENTALHEERATLVAKLDVNQKRLDELEVLVMRFKEDQSRIEDGVMAALNRLSQFEEAFENSLKEKPIEKKTTSKSREKASEPVSSDKPSDSEMFFEIEKPQDTLSDTPAKKSSSQDEINTDSSPAETEDNSVSAGELDIF